MRLTGIKTIGGALLIVSTCAGFGVTNWSPIAGEIPAGGMAGSVVARLSYRFDESDRCAAAYRDVLECFDLSGLDIRDVVAGSLVPWTHRSHKNRRDRNRESGFPDSPPGNPNARACACFDAEKGRKA